MISRRALLATAALASFGPLRAAVERTKLRIRGLKTMTVQGSSRTYVLVKVLADDGLFGIGEAYGSPGVAVKEQILALEKGLLGKNPLEIDVLYTLLDEHAASLAGTRTDGSAHGLMRAASGIEMALWDLTGRALGVPSATLLGGRFRRKVRVYNHAAPRDMQSKASCREWAAKVKEHPSGFTAHKLAFPRSNPDPANRVLTTKELIAIGQGFENCREAIGWDHEIMVHCHWEYDLRTAIQLAETVAPMKPLWLEDPLAVDYSPSWPRLCEASRVPICTGENLARREGFRDFILNHGCDVLHPDLRNSGGFLETKRVADLAALYGLPMANHNTGSQLNTWATCQWASTIRDYLGCETVTGNGGWMDQLLLLEGAYIREGVVEMGDKPGLGADLNPDTVKAHLASGESWWG